MPDTLPLAAAPLSALDIVQRYHQRSKHALNAYAAGPETLDWDAQPDPFRRYAGAVLTPLPLGAEAITTRWADLFEAARVMAQPLTLASLGALFELSFALSAWKQSGPDRWAVRVNPSSGNLHPTEAWLLACGVPGVADGVHHYAPREHALEHRAVVATDTALSSAAADTTPRAWVALSAIAWREAWKYGERAFRYVQLDTGHAVGALRFAAAVLGWQLRAVPVAAADLARLLGLDRDADFGRAEREEPELLFELVAGAPAAQPAQDAAALAAWLAGATWYGQANRLDAHPMYSWPVIDEVMAATRIATTARVSAPASGSAPVASPALAAELSSLPAATLIRQRRSAQRFDARARLPLAALWPLLQALHPTRLPFDAGPATPAVQVLLFAHRVDGLPAGAYLLPRGEGGWAYLRAQLPATEQATRVADAPADVPLWCLAQNPALAGTLRTLNCHQALGSDALLGFALLAEFNPLPDAAAYRARLHEAGLIGQALYLAAEAAGLRGTGIGCFFDDALHQLIGLPEPGAALAPLQSVYHFTVGVAISDPRIVTTPPYAHLQPAPDAGAAAPDGAFHA